VTLHFIIVVTDSHWYYWPLAAGCTTASVHPVYLALVIPLENTQIHRLRA